MLEAGRGVRKLPVPVVRSSNNGIGPTPYEQMLLNSVGQSQFDAQTGATLPLPPGAQSTLPLPPGAQSTLPMPPGPGSTLPMPPPGSNAQPPIINIQQASCDEMMDVNAAMQNWT